MAEWKSTLSAIVIMVRNAVIVFSNVLCACLPLHTDYLEFCSATVQATSATDMDTRSAQSCWSG